MLNKRTLQQLIIPTIIFLCSGAIVEGADSPSAGLPDLEPLSQGIILGRPTDTSVTAHITADEGMDCFIEYRTDPNEFAHRTEILPMLAGDANIFILDDLDPNTQYSYRLWRCPPDSNDFQMSYSGSFHTQRRNSIYLCGSG